MKVKTIDINCKEWFDKVNGNSYFSGSVTVNYGMDDAKSFDIPFQYGYGDCYEYTGFDVLEKNGIIKRDHPHDTWRFCNENGIIKRSSIQRNCKKRELL
jgi:hypothetical protein